MAEQMAEIVYSLAEAQAERQWYPTSAAMVAALAPDHPVFCLRAPVLAEAARRFLAAFPGRVLYAVKCNPHPSVLDSLYGAGIRDFDTASLEEIEAVRGRFGDSRAYFHHPVKSRRAIRRAYHDLGVRHFTVDHAAELDKVLTECGGHDLNIQVRFATPPGYAAFDLSAKFGVKPDRAATLLQAVAEAGAAPGLSFHVGSQCVKLEAYRVALDLAGEIIAAARVPIRSLNVGGGFPVGYSQDVPPLANFMAEITSGVAALGLADDCVLMCEPGRALVADGVSVVVQVQHREDGVVFINDGIFGNLSEMVHGKANLPVRLVRPAGRAADAHQDFTVYGPTCDSNDVLPFKWALPADVAEGDWIEVDQAGAYSNALASRFNGFYSDHFVTIG